MARKFAASLWIWSDVSDAAKEEILFDKILSLGFDGVEIPSFDGNLNAKRINELLSSAGKKRRLTPITIGGGSPQTDLSSELESQRRLGEDYVKKLVDASSKMGGSLVCGPLYSAVGAKKYLTERERSKLVNVVAKEFKGLARYARDRSVRIALEPLCRYDTYLISTASQGRELVDRIGEENIGMLLDTFQMNIEEKSIKKAIDTAGDKLFHFHACENDRGTPGTGLIRWKDVKKGLKNIGYKDWISIESFVPFHGQFSSAMNVWRRIEEEQDEIAAEGLSFLRDLVA